MSPFSWQWSIKAPVLYKTLFYIVEFDILPFPDSQAWALIILAGSGDHKDYVAETSLKVDLFLYIVLRPQHIFLVNSKFPKLPATFHPSPIGENHQFFINFPIKWKTFQSTALILHANSRSSLISYDSHFITSLIIFLTYRSCF